LSWEQAPSLTRHTRHGSLDPKDAGEPRGAVSVAVSLGIGIDVIPIPSTPRARPVAIRPCIPTLHLP